MNKELLTELFSTDKELLSTYHILAPSTAEICAERTLNDLKENNVEIHLIEQDNKVIGYYGIEKDGWVNNLTGFFLKPEFRTKENIVNFWNKIENNFDKDYYIGVYAKNTRAIEFLNKKTTTKYESDDIVVFKVGR
jgi:N-acetylglutamate synthase-like GNAT family acetyltransferase